MSNFNEYFRNYGCKRIVDEFFRGGASGNKPWIDLWSKHKIDKMDYEILPDDGKPASYYLENDQTAAFKVKLTYTVDGGEEKYATSIARNIEKARVNDRFGTIVRRNDCRRNMTFF